MSEIPFNYGKGDRIQHDKASIQQVQLQYLYSGTQDDFVFMNLQTFDQCTLSRAQIGRAASFMKEGLEPIEAVFFEGKCFGVRLPEFVQLKVIKVDPLLDDPRGRLLATLETDASITVPSGVKVDQVITVSTKSGEYVRNLDPPVH